MSMLITRKEAFRKKCTIFLSFKDIHNVIDTHYHLCPGLNDNEMHAPYEKHHKVSLLRI